MSYEEYQNTHHETPYKVVLQSGSNFLYYFGERHSYDPADPQWIQLKTFWEDFLQKTNGQKRIVFTEGGIRPYVESMEEAVLTHGGMGLITHLATKANVNTYSPEPNEKTERDELETKFSRDQIQYYYFARVVHQWNEKQNPKSNFKEYIEPFLKGDQISSGWTDFDFSVENMKNIHTKIFHTEFSESDQDFFYNITNPVVIESVINEVSRASSVFRDEYIVKEIQRYISEGHSIFAEYGCSHVVMQEPFLKEIFTS